jgi:hypothetical protein
MHLGLLSAGMMLLSGTMPASAESYTLKSDLPAVYLNTDDGNDITSTETYVTSTLNYVGTDGSVTPYEGVKVRGRGSAMFQLAKKPYKLKFASKVRLLGSSRANAKKWNLMAHHGDKTLIRNAVASYIADLTGQPFSPGCQFVDFSLNGKYYGTYQITDQIDIRKKRVNITEQPEVVTDATNITGGYLLEIDDSADDLEGSVFTTTHGMKVTIKSPDEDVLVDAQANYISAYVQQFEDALFADNWLDATKGYKAYIDLDSFVQWYIVTELTGEPNSFRSVYFYKDKDKTALTFGPVWDFDFAFDNSARFGSRPKALIAQEGRGDEWCFTWINRMRQDPAFHTAVNTAWRTLVANGLEKNVLNYIDQTAATIDKSQQLNFGLYDISQKAHDEQFLFSTYAEGITFLKEYVSARISFLNDAFQTLANGGTVPVTTDPESGISAPAAPASDYYVTVADRTLRFTSALNVDGSFSVINTAGATLLHGAIAPEISLASLPAGIYVLTWTDTTATTRSAKFTLR